MVFNITSKNCKLTENSYNRINHNLEKLVRSLPHLNKDLIVFRLIIKSNIDKYHPQKVHHHTHKSYSDSKPELAYFEGSINFRLDKKKFFTHFKGQTIDECLQLGFKRIYKELEKYKDLHFSSESEYPDKTSIRKSVINP